MRTHSYIHVHIHTHTHAYKYTYTHTYMNTCTYKLIHTHKHTNRCCFFWRRRRLELRQSLLHHHDQQPRRPIGQWRAVHHARLPSRLLPLGLILPRVCCWHLQSFFWQRVLFGLPRVCQQHLLVARRFRLLFFVSKRHVCSRHVVICVYYIHFIFQLHE